MPSLRFVHKPKRAARPRREPAQALRYNPAHTSLAPDMVRTLAPEPTSPGTTTPLECYLALPESAPYELIDGDLLKSTAPRLLHQRISRRLTPDIFIVRNERAHLLEERGMAGSPDFVIEIVSPSAPARDTELKKTLYERFGVQEFWLVNPSSKQIDLFFLVEGLFEPQGVWVRTGTPASRLFPGLTFDLVSLFKGL
jgi:Uma2 family endonuclease